MTSQARNPDPDPTEIPGELPSGSVQPGETPPAESSVSAVQGHDEGAPARWTSWVWLGAIGLVVVFGALAFLGYGIGLLD